MFLMYVDESGDTGRKAGSSAFYVLSGLVFHELHWKTSLDKLILFRRGLKDIYALPTRTEIHAGEYISNTPPRILNRVKRHERLMILRKLLDEAARNQDFRITTIIVDKAGKSPDYDVFENAWQALIQRFENTIKYCNFPGPERPNDKGIIFPDVTSNRKLTKLLRKMRYHNFVPKGAVLGGGSRNLPIEIVIEDPNPRNSRDSYFIQIADCAAYFAYQYVQPNKYIKGKGAHHFYRRLESILNLHAAPRDPDGLGLVRL